MNRKKNNYYDDLYEQSNEYDDPDDELREQKRDDSYHFSIPFTYIKRKLGNDQYEDGTAYMEIDLVWDEAQLGYVVSYYVPNMDEIRPEEGNGDEQEIYENIVYFDLMDELESLDIYATALVGAGII
ncbi:hypothetical protein [Butyrivibrio sp. WCD3002]|uniref:hypothetical protein n=1 Tax=Butyrivibrio sp. WCD3002 TaxID=1280676 RepID=UPI0003F7C67F|nr:hypothetical protein [Butyrivibrio sp. WCD3002]